MNATNFGSKRNALQQSLTAFSLTAVVTSVQSTANSAPNDDKMAAAKLRLLVYFIPASLWLMYPSHCRTAAAKLEK